MFKGRGFDFDVAFVASEPVTSSSSRSRDIGRVGVKLRLDHTLGTSKLRNRCRLLNTIEMLLYWDTESRVYLIH